MIRRLLLLACGALCLSTPSAAQAAPRVRLGIDVLLSERLDLVAGKRVGLVTNPSGVDGALVMSADRLHAHPKVDLVRLFGPEHGIRGAVAAGEKVADGRDGVTGLPVISLYGRNRRPTKAQLAGLDLLLFDIQDLGSRTYTYVSTLGECLIACGEVGLPLVVLDRPNPLGGLRFEGAIIPPRLRSFIGWGPMPVTHGLTIGECALYLKAQRRLKTRVEVVRMKGWRREMVWEDTGLRWTPTSPHIPHALHAHLYVATGMIGGVTENVNEGVGYTLPFETIAAEWIDGHRLARHLRARKLPGVSFRRLSYRPFYSRHQGKSLGGVQLLLEDPRAFEPLRTALEILAALEELWPGKTAFKDEETFDRHWGDPGLLEQIRDGVSAPSLRRRWAAAERRFATARARHLLYR